MPRKDESNQEPRKEVKQVRAKTEREWFWTSPDKVGHEPPLSTEEEQREKRAKFFRLQFNRNVDLVDGQDMEKGIHEPLPKPLHNTLIERTFHCNTNVGRFAEWLAETTGGRPGGRGGSGTVVDTDEGQFILFFARYMQSQSSGQVTVTAMKGAYHAWEEPDLTTLGNIISFTIRAVAVERIEVYAACISPDVVDYYYSLLARIGQTWPESGLAAEGSTRLIEQAPTVQAPNIFIERIERQEVTMGNKNEFRVGDINNESGVVNIGFENTITNLQSAGHSDLADALKQLTDAVLASHSIPEEQKQEQVEVIKQIGDEAAKGKPNKTLIKMLGDGLLATLKAVPDVAKAVAAAAPILEKFIQ